MSAVESLALPERALLARYLDTGAYTDCYSLSLECAVSQAEYVEAFYTSWIFKLERIILKWLAAKPSTDAEAKLLAAGTIHAFAAWTVEDRSPDQLLMCDFQGNTRSWFMTEPVGREGGRATRLYFGSAVVPVHRAPFRALLGFHKLYSRVLLRAAARRLVRGIAQR